eukprot:GILK01009816.1.p1 GENE.GILK01009816.1~~GILK01009816.1.p1  ORF type:complete len:1037 (-),score=315.19 GILK01009816.1:105-2873(-)
MAESNGCFSERLQTAMEELKVSTEEKKCLESQLNLLRTQTEVLTTELTATEKDNKSVRAELARLESSLASSQNVEKMAEVLQSTLNESRMEFDIQVQDMEARISDLGESVCDSERKLCKAEEEKEALSLQCEEKSKLIESLEQKLLLLQETISNETVARTSELQADVERLTLSVHSLEAELSLKCNDVLNMNVTITDFKQQIVEMTQERNQVQLQLEEMIKEKALLLEANRIEKMENDRLYEEILDLRSELDRSIGSNERNKTTEDEKIQMLNQLEVQSETIRHLNRSLEEQGEELHAIHNVNSQQDQLNHELNTRLVSSTESISDLTRVNVELRKTLICSKVYVSGLKRINRDLEGELASAKETVQSLTVELDHLRTVGQFTHQQHVSDTQETLSVLRTENEVLKQNHGQLERELTESLDVLNKAKSEYEIMQQRVVQLEGVIDSQETELTQLSDDLELERSQVAVLNEHITELRTAKLATEDAKYSVETELRESQMRFQTDSDQLKSQIMESRDMIASLLSRLEEAESTVNRFKGEHGHLVAEISRLKAESTESVDQMKKLEEEKTVLINRINCLEQQAIASSHAASDQDSNQSQQSDGDWLFKYQSLLLDFETLKSDLEVEKLQHNDHILSLESQIHNLNQQLIQSSLVTKSDMDIVLEHGVMMQSPTADTLEAASQTDVSQLGLARDLDRLLREKQILNQSMFDLTQKMSDMENQAKEALVSVHMLSRSAEEKELTITQLRSTIDILCAQIETQKQQQTRSPTIQTKADQQDAIISSLVGSQYVDGTPSTEAHDLDIFVDSETGSVVESIVELEDVTSDVILPPSQVILETTMVDTEEVQTTTESKVSSTVSSPLAHNTVTKTVSSHMPVLMDIPITPPKQEPNQESDRPSGSRGWLLRSVANLFLTEKEIKTEISEV